MKAETLLNYIGSVDEQYIQELFDDTAVSASKPIKVSRWHTVAACFALFIAGTVAMITGIGGTEYANVSIGHHTLTLPMSSYTTVMIDVNPSIKLEVNDRNVVITAEAVNDDAEQILKNTKLIGKDCNAAVKTAVQQLQKQGYITDLKNSVLVSVVDEDEENADLIRGNIVKTLKTLSNHADYGLSVLSQVLSDDSAYEKLSAKYNISTGRVLLIEKLCKQYPDFSIDELADENIQTLNQLIVYVGLPENIERIGEAAGVVPEKYRDEVKLDDLKPDEIVNFASAISDFYTKLSEYYDEKDIVDQIGYVLDINEGITTSGEKLWGVIAESRNQLVGSQGAVIKASENVVSDWYDQKNISKVKDFVNGLIEKAS